MDLSPQEGEVQVLFIQTPSSDSHCAFNHININWERPKWCCQALRRFCPARGLPIVTLMYSLPLKDPFHMVLSSIWLFIHQSLPLTTNISEPSSKRIYQTYGYLRGKGVPKSLSKVASGKSPTYCSYAGQASGAQLLYTLYRVFQTLSKQVSFQPALYTSPKSCSFV